MILETVCRSFGERALLIMALTGLLAWHVRTSPLTITDGDEWKMPEKDGPGPEVKTHADEGPTWHVLETNKQNCDATPLYVDTKGYEMRCQPRRGPCFSIDGFELSSVNIEPWYEAYNMTEGISVLDNNAHDFAVNNASVAFQLNYGQFHIRYSEYNPETNCYKIELMRDDEPTLRLGAGGTPDYRELDTLKGSYTATTFCYDHVYFWLTGGA